MIEEAADHVEAALGRAHRYTTSKTLRKAAQRLGEEALQLASLFAGLRDELCDHEDD